MTDERLGIGATGADITARPGAPHKQEKISDGRWWYYRRPARRPWSSSPGAKR